MVSRRAAGLYRIGLHPGMGGSRLRGGGRGVLRKGLRGGIFVRWARGGGRDLMSGDGKVIRMFRLLFEGSKRIGRVCRFYVSLISCSSLRFGLVSASFRRVWRRRVSTSCLFLSGAFLFPAPLLRRLEVWASQLTSLRSCRCKACD